MDIFATLQEENATIRRLLRQLLDSSAGRPEERRDLFLEVSARLHAEIRAEEGHLYPLLAQIPQTREGAIQSREAVRAIEELLTEMAGSDPDDPRFGRLAEQLYGEADSRLSREEHELFPMAREVVTEEQAAMLGDRVENEMRRFREEFWGH
jgi:hypothetical protein